MAKTITNSATVETKDNGSITFIAARNVQNMNGFTYSVETLQAQNAQGDYILLGNEPTDVSIPLMTNHSSDIKNKIGTIETAHIEDVDGVKQAVMTAKFFDTTEAQEIRQRVLDNQLTDVSITTDYGDNEDVFETGNLDNAKIVEVSVVYAGAEPKAKITAKNSIEKDEEQTEEDKTDETAENATEEETEETQAKTEEQADTTEDEEQSETEEESEELTNEENEESEMAKQPTNATADKVADKSLVLNSLAKLAKNGAIAGLNRNQVIEAVKNEIDLLGTDGNAYVVPDAVFTEILAVTRPTDILDTFKTVPGKRFTLMSEVPSDADLARAGKWSKGELKAIQEGDLRAQKFTTDFLFKLQELSYADMQEDFGDLLLAYIRNELPQKVTEEEERAFIVGDGRDGSNSRQIDAIVSFAAAAADAGNPHAVQYDGSNDASAVAALMNGVAKIDEEGVVNAVMSKATLTSLRAAGLSTAAGLPWSEETVAGAIGVNKIYTREYVTGDVAYVYVGEKVIRLTGPSDSIEQYDIDYNNRKIEFIRPVGGGASGIASVVEVTLPATVSA